MGAAGDFRHHAAIQGVEVNLAEHHVRHDGAAVFHHGGGGFVAGGFQGQNAHPILFPQRLRRIPGRVFIAYTSHQGFTSLVFHSLFSRHATAAITSSAPSQVPPRIAA